MDDPALDRLKSILERASKLSNEDRRHLLDRECGDDEYLRAQLEQLLRLHDTAGSFLHPETAPSGSSRSTAPEPAGRTIGVYTILEKIGEGGFGTVYLAQQHEPISRRVALKLIRAGASSSQVLARFQAERHVLALMDHPNIAVVHDAGVTDQGDPYFVMEYVAGFPITKYADDQKLGLEDRLRLSMQLCEAVQHAHQKGVLHRDLKPSNVLVARSGEKSLVKVIDFGVAKAMDAQLGGETIHTQQGTVVGTPEYMSPEQAWGAPSGVDTRTDVYSLGVILYELLVGSVPFDRKAPDVGLLDLLQQIREKEPQKLSTRLSSSREAIEIASLRRTDPPSLARRLRGDLEWITRKALEKDPERRYSSAATLAEDIGRHLANHPILARSPSTTYHIQKLVARHRAVTALAGTLVMAIIVFAVAMSGMYNGQRIERLKAEHVSAFLQDMLASADPERARGDQLLVRDVLDQAAVKASTELVDEPEVAAAVIVTLAKAYDGLGLPSQSLSLARAAAPIAAQLHGRKSVEHAHALNTLGNAFLAAGHADSAIAALQEAQFVLEDRRDSHPIELAYTLGLSMNALRDLGKYDESERLGRESLELYAQHVGRDQPDYAWSLVGLSITLEKQGKLEEAEVAQREALTIHEKEFGSDHPDVLTDMSNLAVLLDKQGKCAEAESLYRATIAVQRRVLGESHPQYAGGLNNLAVLLRSLHRYDEAESLYCEALNVRRKALGDQHPGIATCLNNLALLNVAQDRDSKAEPLYREALAIRLHAYGENHPEVATVRHNLAVALYYQSKLEESERLERQALTTKLALTSADDPDVLKSTQFLAQILLARKKPQEARQLIEDCITHQCTTKNVNIASAAWSRNLLGQCWLREGDAGAAEPILVASLEPVLADAGGSMRRKRAALNATIEALASNGKSSEAAVFRARLDSLSIE